jgi:hypothetical protein
MPESVRCIVAADAILISIHFQHVLRPIRIVLHCRQGLSQPAASLGKRETGPPEIGTGPVRVVEDFGES